MPLELAFSTRALRRLCEGEANAQVKLGVRVAARLKARLADLAAASAITDLPAGRVRPCEGTGSRDLLLDIGEDHFLRISANHQKVPMRPDGDVDWARVTRLKIVGTGKVIVGAERIDA